MKVFAPAVNPFGPGFSYQKRSPFLKFLNWVPMIQANVGPTIPPLMGFSDSPAGNRSMSSTCLINHKWYLDEHKTILFGAEEVLIEMLCFHLLIL